MAANRFATMLHRRTNRITFVLVYALLEWVLILLLFMSSLFSHLIIKFAKFFGLKPPCPWCTRIDHIFDSSNGSKSLHRDLLCEVHAKEVSRFGFCSIHSKLAESQDMCHDCLFSMPEFALFSRIKGFPNDEMVGGNSEQNLMCSCCGLSFPFQKDDLVYTQNKILISEEQNHSFERDDSDKKASEFVEEDKYMERMDNWLKELGKDAISGEEKLEEFVHVCEDSCSNQHLVHFLDHTGHNLVPLDVLKNEKNADIRIDDDDDKTVNPECTSRSDEHNNVEENEHSLVFHAKDTLLNEYATLEAFQIGHWPSVDASDDQGGSGAGAAIETPLSSHTDYEESEEAAHVHTETEADVSIGTDIPDLDISDEVRTKESPHTPEHDREHDLLALSSGHDVEENGPEQVEEQTVELQTKYVTNSASFQLESQENETQDNEEDKVPDTPASMDSFSQFQKNMLFLEKRDSWTEDSFDGSLTSELDICDGVVTIESLKSALKAERKALKILYAEFEEERNASCVAASQTMAMINRLQEEKAAMQMEALQYQRMMEEQSEYDQDALQLMNELMVKRENEKRELEKEFEECRKKLFVYEANRTMNTEDKKSRSGEEFGEKTTISYNGVLTDFEHERMSILEQLKFLQDKLFTLDDANGVHVNGSLDDTADSKEREWIRCSDHKGKSLLPLFDAVGDENEYEIMQSNGVHNTHQDYEEEMCHLYERLEALETDKEFLKQCIGSLKQGEKELVHEILQHLRDLRNLEKLRARTRQDF